MGHGGGSLPFRGVASAMLPAREEPAARPTIQSAQPERRGTGSVSDRSGNSPVPSLGVGLSPTVVLPVGEVTLDVFTLSPHSGQSSPLSRRRGSGTRPAPVLAPTPAPLLALAPAPAPVTHTLTLPLPGAHGDGHAAVSLPPPPADALRGMRVLVVDDEKSIRRLCQRMLDKLGCECVTLEDGDQVMGALVDNGYVVRGETGSVCEHRRFDAIFMDIMMVRSNGVDVVCDLRAKFEGGESTPHGSHGSYGPENGHTLPPILAMTANTSLSDITSYRNAGFANVLGKPFDVGTMRAKLLAATRVCQ